MSVEVHLAPAVVPVSEPPLADGAVAVAGGRIVAVGPRDEVLGRFPGAEARSWEGVIVPGLVNAHTHLQYSSFVEVGASTHPNYVEWSTRFVAEYEGRVGEDWRAAAMAGLEASVAAGVTCFADIVTNAEALDVLVEAGVAGVTYNEMIGVDLDRWEGGFAAQLEEVLRSAPQGPAVRVGLSPHAPYSIEEPVLARAAALARSLGMRIHVHLAESDSEDEYYRHGTGQLADRVAMRVGRRWGVLGRGGSGLGAAEFAAACGLLGPDTHMAHGVHLGPAGRRLLAETGTYVALCPRSNVTVGVGPPPVADYLAEGVPFAVGTDSLASNRSLDLMEDVAFLRELAFEGGYHRPDLDRRLLEAATLGGARALGMDGEVGSLEPGKRADLAIFDVDPTPTRVETALTTSAAGRCLATVTGGRS